MRSLKSSFLSEAVILFVITASANADRQLIDLGPGVAYSINDSHQIVGTSDASGNGYAILFDSTGGGANIKLSDDHARSYSINNSGQIVGTIGFANACLFDGTGAGNNKYLVNLDSVAYSINDNGLIVGDYYDAGQYACLYTTKYDPLTHKIVPVVVNLGTIGEKGFPPPPTRSSAVSISNKGHIVGYIANANVGGPYFTHACLFDETGNKHNINLGALGGSNSKANSINDSDQIVGWATTSVREHACLFDNTGRGNNIDLGALDGWEYSKAFFINNYGQIVGNITKMDPYVHHACIFDATGSGNNIDLNTFIDPTSGWVLSNAYCINNNGWIVGDMINTNGEIRAFLLTPEPATLLLFALACPCMKLAGGGAAILRKRKY
jgi:uncharacterized membrane protein